MVEALAPGNPDSLTCRWCHQPRIRHVSGALLCRTCDGMAHLNLPAMVPKGWTREDRLGGGRSLLTYPDGSVRIRHVCDRGSRGTIICAPLLQLGAGHTLTRNQFDRATVTPSIACPDCGLHGFVTDGAWKAC